MSFVEDTLRSAVSAIQMDTAWGPQILMADPFASDPAAPPSPLLGILKPKLSIYFRGFPNPLVSAPYGDPGESKWPFVAIGLGAVGIFVLYRILQRKG